MYDKIINKNKCRIINKHKTYTPVLRLVIQKKASN